MDEGRIEVLSSESLDEEIMAWFEANPDKHELHYGFRRTVAFSTAADNTLSIYLIATALV